MENEQLKKFTYAITINICLLLTQCDSRSKTYLFICCKYFSNEINEITHSINDIRENGYYAFLCFTLHEKERN